MDPIRGLPRSANRVGQPVVAKHSQEAYKLRSADELEPPQAGPGNPDGYPALAQVQQVAQAITLEPMPVQTALEVTRDGIEELGRKYEIFSSNGKRLKRKFEAAPAFPIVVLTTRQLMNAASRPEELLVPSTSSLLVPVVDRNTREISGSFLYFRDRDTWKQGGYRTPRSPICWSSCATGTRMGSALPRTSTWFRFPNRLRSLRRMVLEPMRCSPVSTMTGRVRW